MGKIIPIIINDVILIRRVLLVFAMLGMLSPASRGALGTCAIFLYVSSGLIAGYFSARLYKTMRGRKWRRTALLVRNIKYIRYQRVDLGMKFIILLFCLL